MKDKESKQGTIVIQVMKVFCVLNKDLLLVSAIWQLIYRYYMLYNKKEEQVLPIYVFGREKFFSKKKGVYRNVQKKDIDKKLSINKFLFLEKTRPCNKESLLRLISPCCTYSQSSENYIAVAIYWVPGPWNQDPGAIFKGTNGYYCIVRSYLNKINPCCTRRGKR